MIARLRRLRFLPILLTLLSPAVGGELLPLLHPCPVEQPWSAGAAAPRSIAESAASDHAHHGSATSPDESSAPSHDHGGPGSCSCLGSCHTPGLITGPQAPIVVVAVEGVQPILRNWFAIESRATTTVAELLPPKTAPPIA